MARHNLPARPIVATPAPVTQLDPGSQAEADAITGGLRTATDGETALETSGLTAGDQMGAALGRPLLDPSTPMAPSTMSAAATQTSATLSAHSDPALDAIAAQATSDVTFRRVADEGGRVLDAGGHLVAPEPHFGDRPAGGVFDAFSREMAFRGEPDPGPGLARVEQLMRRLPERRLPDGPVRVSPVDDLLLHSDPVVVARAREAHAAWRHGAPDLGIKVRAARDTARELDRSSGRR